MLERIFNDENEPFWRSAKQMELGVIASAALPRLHRRSGSRGPAAGSPPPPSRVLAATLGYPYATQELCYFLWEETPEGRRRDETSGYDVCAREAPPAPSTPTSAWYGRRPRWRNGSCSRRWRPSRAGHSWASTAAATGSQAPPASNAPSRRSSRKSSSRETGEGRVPAGGTVRRPSGCCGASSSAPSRARRRGRVARGRGSAVAADAREPRADRGGGRSADSTRGGDDCPVRRRRRGAAMSSGRARRAAWRL